MAAGRREKESGSSQTSQEACAATGLDTGCKILPFKQKRFRGCSATGGIIGFYSPVQPADTESQDIGLQCEDNEVLDHGQRSEEPTGKGSFLRPRWITKILIMSIFAAWTAAAIALAIALG